MNADDVAANRDNMMRHHVFEEGLDEESTRL
jgi:hypothetical protein